MNSFRLVPKRLNKRRLFKDSEIDLNLHIFSAGTPEIERHLLLRDRLRDDLAEGQLDWLNPHRYGTTN